MQEIYGIICTYIENVCNLKGNKKAGGNNNLKRICFNGVNNISLCSSVQTDERNLSPVHSSGRLLLIPAYITVGQDVHSSGYACNILRRLRKRLDSLQW